VRAWSLSSDLKFIANTKEEVALTGVHGFSWSATSSNDNINRDQSNNIDIGHTRYSLQYRVDIREQEGMAEWPAASVIATENGVQKSANRSICLFDHSSAICAGLHNEPCCDRYSQIFRWFNVDDCPERASWFDEIANAV
jgi:hypothetical protein